MACDKGAESADFEEGHIVLEREKDALDETKPEPPILRSLRHREATGSQYRTITQSRPNLFPLITSPKKGSHTKVLEGWFGSNGYSFNDTMTCAFAELKDAAEANGEVVFMITATFSDEYNEELRQHDSEDTSRTMPQVISKRLQDAFERVAGYRWKGDAVIVLEEGARSKVNFKHLNQRCKRLHAHILTRVTRNSVELLRSALRPLCSQVQVQDIWKNRRLLNELDEVEEEQFGEMPIGTIDPEHPHWTNTYKYQGRDGRWWTAVEVPVCGRAADYLSKQLNSPLCKDRNFSLIGLKGTSERRKRLYELGKALK